ncbi:MAG: hypothetical protein IT310_10605 [Anaerolineales bacterium]|nr:hypothetical protein [Anaerolineales bacterium]
MTFTILYFGFALLVLALVFGVTFKLKGWKIALAATGGTFVLFALGLVAAIYAITSAM